MSSITKEQKNIDIYTADHNQDEIKFMAQGLAGLGHNSGNGGGGNGHGPVEYGSVREALLANIDDPNLWNRVDRNLYKEGSTIGIGGLSSALVHEAATRTSFSQRPDGTPIWHDQAVLEHAQALSKQIDNQTKPLNNTDKALAADQAEDLRIAYSVYELAVLIGGPLRKK